MRGSIIRYFPQAARAAREHYEQAFEAFDNDGSGWIRSVVGRAPSRVVLGACRIALAPPSSLAGHDGLIGVRAGSSRGELLAAMQQVRAAGILCLAPAGYHAPSFFIVPRHVSCWWRCLTWRVGRS